MQGKYVIAYDLGTGGLKASLHDASGTTLAFLVCEYPTLYYKEVFHEQRPEDWWQAICRSTRLLLDKVKEQNICKEQICALAISGHSLVGIPMDREGRPLVGQVPIWSDGRAKEQARRFFETHDYNAWYETTGNGDPPACYTLFKIMWMRENQPEIYEKTAYILGSKDYINFRLTGAAGTDYSYASGTGAFDLRRMCYVDAYIRDAGLRRELFLEPGQSHELLGRVTVQAATEIGLCPGTLVARGGVDNACMALGSCGLGDDRVYMSLGSCAWISATTRQPVLDSALHPFVFAHVEKGWYCSAVSILSACTSLSWAKEMLCRDFSAQTDAYQRKRGPVQPEPCRRRNTSRQSGASGCISGDSARKPQRGSSARGAGRHRTGSFRDMGKLFQPHSYAGRTAYYRRRGQKCTVAGDFCRNIRN